MELTPFLLREICGLSAELGAINALIVSGKIKPYLKKSEAFKKYGRANVEQWLRDDLITPRKDGSHSATWRLELMELETLAKTIRLQELINHL